MILSQGPGCGAFLRVDSAAPRPRRPPVNPSITMPKPVRPARRRGLPLLAAIVCGIVVAACSTSDDLLPPENIAPAALQVVAPQPITGLPGRPLPDAVTVRAVDAQGNGIAGTLVDFAVESGGGSLSTSNALTNAEGYASVTWTLGIAGEQVLRVFTDGLSAVQVRAQLVDPPAGSPGLAGG
jgi:hypothetical protein